jgi:hypothetical protein
MAQAYTLGVQWAESALTPLAQRLVQALEDAEDDVVVPCATKRDLEAELLQGSTLGVVEQDSCASTIEGSGVVASACSAAEAMQLRDDCKQLLQQREQLRARLIAEQERRERAEAELVQLGAQWLGTDTQEALRKRAEAERQRALDAARNAIQCEADQRVARLQAENGMLLQRLGAAAPSALEMQLQLRNALQSELVTARKEARDAVQTQLAQTIEERDRLAAALRQAEAAHRSELEILRTSVRKASELLQEQYDNGFVNGLKQAASALGQASIADDSHAFTRADETPQLSVCSVASHSNIDGESPRGSTSLPCTPARQGAVLEGLQLRSASSVGLDAPPSSSMWSQTLALCDAHPESNARLSVQQEKEGPTCASLDSISGSSADS